MTILKQKSKLEIFRTDVVLKKSWIIKIKVEDQKNSQLSYFRKKQYKKQRDDKS